jgi:hypothetical protein
MSNPAHLAGLPPTQENSGHLLISYVAGENLEPVTGLGAAEARATESSGLAGFGLASARDGGWRMEDGRWRNEDGGWKMMEEGGGKLEE